MFQGACEAEGTHPFHGLLGVLASLPGAFREGSCSFQFALPPPLQLICCLLLAAQLQEAAKALSHSNPELT